MIEKNIIFILFLNNYSRVLELLSHASSIRLKLFNLINNFSTFIKMKHDCVRKNNNV